MPDFDNYDDVREAMASDPSITEVFDDVRTYIDSINYLKRHRKDKVKLSVDQVAYMLECAPEDVEALEEGKDVEVSFMQRYARAIGVRAMIYVLSSKHDYGSPVTAPTF